MSHKPPATRSDFKVKKNLYVTKDAYVGGELTVDGGLNSSSLSAISLSARKIYSGNYDLVWDVDHWNSITQPLSVADITIFEQDVSIKGDLRVDGNAYLSAGSGGTINVGDNANDNVVFHADVDSNILPQTDVTYNLGSIGQQWNTLYVQDISAVGLATTGHISWPGGSSEIANDTTLIVGTFSGDWNYITTSVAAGTANWNTTYNTVTTKEPLWDDNKVTVDNNKSVWDLNSLSALGDVDVSSGISNQDILKYELASNSWKPVPETSTGTGSPTTSAFIVLDDTPIEYVTHRGETVIVNSGETGLEFTPYDSDLWNASSNLITTTSGINGFANLNVGGKLLDSQLPNLAISNVTAIQGATNVAGLSSSVFRSDIVIVTDYYDNLVANIDNPSGTYYNDPQMGGTYAGYEKLAWNKDWVSTVNNLTGPIILLTPDDIIDTLSTNKFVTSADKGNWNSVYTSVSDTSGQWNSVYTSVSAASAAWSSTANKVDSVHSTVNTASAEWNAVYSNVAGTSAGRDSVYTSVSDTSANWDAVYSNVTGTSAKRDSVYTSVTDTSATWDDIATKVQTNSGSWEESQDIQNVADDVTVMSLVSSEWDSVYTSVSDISATWDAVYSNVATTSANRDSVYTSVSDTSASWDVVYSNVASASADRDSVYTSVSDTSAAWDVVYSNVAETSASRDAVYSNVATTSADRDSVYTSVSDTSAEWDAVYSNVATTSADRDSVYTSVSDTSAEWDAVYSNVAGTSAKRDSVYTSVSDTSAEWDSVYSFVNSDSGTNNTNYNQTHFVNTSGDTMTGHLEGTTAYFTSLTALSAITHVIDITVHELSGFDIDGDITWTGGGSVNANAVYNNVASTSADRDSVYTSVSDTSASWDTVYSNVATSSADRNSVYTSVTDTSANWDTVYSNVATTSADRDSVYTSVSDTSAEWNAVYSNVATTSAKRDSVYTSVTDTSANWDTVYSNVATTSAKRDSVYTSVTDTSATWDDIATKVQANSSLWEESLDIQNVADDVTVMSLVSSEWDSAYTSLNTISGVYTSVVDTSGEWDAVYSFVNSDSGANNSNYNHSHFVAISGDNMTGNLTVLGDISASGDIYASNNSIIFADGEKFGSQNSKDSKSVHTYVNAVCAQWNYAYAKLTTREDEWDEAVTRINSALEGESAEGIAVLGGDGKLLNSQIPELSITRVHVATSPGSVSGLSSSQANNYVATGIQVGDVVVVTETDDNIIVLDTNASNFGKYNVSTGDYNGYERLRVRRDVNTDSITYDSSPPTYPSSGTGWVDSGTNILHIYSGTQWIQLSGTGGGSGGLEADTPHVLTRSSAGITTPGGEREYLTMQDNEPANDVIWNDVTYAHAMVLPYSTIIKRVVVRAENSYDATIRIGLHSNKNVTNYLSNDWIYFPSAPMQEQSRTFLADNASEVFLFTGGGGTSTVGSTLGVSISANKPLGRTNVTIVLAYSTGQEFSNAVNEMVSNAFAAAAEASGLDLTVNIVILDTLANILARTNDPTGTIAFATDTLNLMIYDPNNLEDWSVFENE